MKATDQNKPANRVVILPLPVWGLVALWQLVAWLLRTCWKWCAKSKQKKLPKRTNHQQDPDCARMAWLLFAKLNYYRLTLGLPQMVWNEQLEQSSLYHGQRMVETDEFDHVLSDGVKLSERVLRFKYSYSTCAENLAYYEDPLLSIEQLAHEMHDGWVHSPGHHANLVSDCKEVGIGVAKIGYRYYAVQNFGIPCSANNPTLMPFG